MLVGEGPEREPKDPPQTEAQTMAVMSLCGLELRISKTDFARKGEGHQMVCLRSTIIQTDIALRSLPMVDDYGDG